jgi:putative FmdB family regulatory protein
MPIYEYKCTSCNDQFEVTQKITDDPLSTCEHCGGELKRLITNTSFVLKGSGWYVTDYPSPERKKAMEEAKKATEGTKKQDDRKKEAVGSK